MTVEILSNGALNLVQDLGRPGHLDIGVSPSGAMDAAALSMANWMVGNEAGAAGIEISMFPLRVKLLQAVRFATAGAAASVTLPNRSWPTWWSAQAAAGDVLTIAAPAHGARVYLAFAAGIDVPVVLGARATDLKSGFGGHLGRGLRKADRLALLPATGQAPMHAAGFGVVPRLRIDLLHELSGGVMTIRLLAGAEFAQFSAASVQAFFATPYRLTPDCNRQGYRLEGEALALTAPLDLLSHGIVPGTVQVPPSGQPIIQMAEANTCGGYPKIGTVIEADLWRLAQLRPGLRVRFQQVNYDDAMAAQRALDDEQTRIRDALVARQQASCG